MAAFLRHEKEERKKKPTQKTQTPTLLLRLVGVNSYNLAAVECLASLLTQGATAHFC